MEMPKRAAEMADLVGHRVPGLIPDPSPPSTTGAPPAQPGDAQALGILAIQLSAWLCTGHPQPLPEGTQSRL